MLGNLFLHSPLDGVRMTQGSNKTGTPNINRCSFLLPLIPHTPVRLLCSLQIVLNDQCFAQMPDGFSIHQLQTTGACAINLSIVFFSCSGISHVAVFMAVFIQ